MAIPIGEPDIPYYFPNFEAEIFAIDDDGKPIFRVDSLGNQIPVDSLGRDIIQDTTQIQKDSLQLKINVRKIEKK